MTMEITFLTTSTISDIQVTQSRCIKKFFPDSEHVIIDGNKSFPKVWYEWLDVVKDSESDWFIHIDEDCFITSPDEILKLIEEMKSGGYDIAGSPDGYNEFYRHGNHMAINSFFMVLNKSVIDTWHNRTGNCPQFKKDWIEEYPFERHGDSHFIYNVKLLDGYHTWVPYSEPYYGFLWVLKQKGLKFKYIEPVFNPTFSTTDLLNGTVKHMWFQRQRKSVKVVSAAHTISNKDRFDGMLLYINHLLLSN